MCYVCVCIADIEMKVTVDWSKLELAPFCTLVSTVEEHDKMQRLLDSTLEGISANKSAVNISDRLTELLSVHCFLYFSAGDRFRYEASKVTSLSFTLLDYSLLKFTSPISICTCFHFT